MTNSTFHPSKILRFLFILVLGSLTSVKAQNKTIPGEITTPYPTIINLAVEWTIQGDDNQNGVVKVNYREKGTVDWHEAMPLFRVPAGENIGFTWQNKHSGSIFDLTPDTLYEIQLNLQDPDGGSSQKVVEARTRPEPSITPNAEIIDLKAGVYDTLFTKSGTKERPIVYQSKDRSAIYKFIDLRNKKWVYIEGVTVSNLDTIARHKGHGVMMDGAENCTIRYCTINAVYGIVAYKPGATNCNISDNVLTGTVEWRNNAMGPKSDNVGEGIQITGPGNVISYNRVTGFRDNISTMEDKHVVNQQCIDIYNNDIFRAADDGIEADFCFSNCRIFRNRLTNTFVALSSQPGLGGPNYFVRNAMYNTHNAFKLMRFSQGDAFLHNTVVKAGYGLGGNSKMDYAYFRNNLAIGGGEPGAYDWGGYDRKTSSAAEIKEPGEHSSFDYDAVGAINAAYEAKIGDKPFSEVEPNGIEGIKLEDTFENVLFPYLPVPERDAPDLRLKVGSLAIDAALPIPNINIPFEGKAPDIGAYEYGRERPHYGPRF